MLVSANQPVQQLADRLVRCRTAGAADRLVQAVDADCFTELVARSTLAGRLNRELFLLLDAAFDAHTEARALERQAAEIAALPEAAHTGARRNP